MNKEASIESIAPPLAFGDVLMSNAETAETLVQAGHIDTWKTNGSIF